MCTRYEWTHLNGYSEPPLLDRLAAHFGDYADQIGLHVNVVYQPRHAHAYAIKPANCRLPLTYVELAPGARCRRQSTVDTALAKLGGVRQLLVLLAKLVEAENKSWAVSVGVSGKGNNFRVYVYNTTLYRFDTH